MLRKINDGLFWLAQGLCWVCIWILLYGFAFFFYILGVEERTPTCDGCGRKLNPGDSQPCDGCSFWAAL